MAKSIRSKWKRKCRAIKRERYAAKELVRLKKMLGVKDEEKVNEKEVMESEEVIFLDAGAISKKKQEKKRKQPVPEDPEDVEMSSDGENIEVEGENGQKRVYNSKTLKDRDGQYPIWLHKRKIAKMNRAATKKLKKRSKKRKR